MKTVAGFRRHLVAGGTVAQRDNRRGPGRPWAELGLHGVRQGRGQTTPATASAV